MPRLLKRISNFVCHDSYLKYAMIEMNKSVFVTQILYRQNSITKLVL